MPVAVDRSRVVAALPAYEIGEQLGAGAYGLVLAGRHRDLDRHVAIKVLSAKQTAGSPTNFNTEARLLAGLNHPHIVGIHDYVECDELHLLIMELLSGGTVTDRRKALSAESACAVGLAAADALSWAHTHGVLHRDVKPDNMMFSGDGLLKVTDFGIAKMFDGSAVTASAVVGTPKYMAPEQFDTGRLSPATDLYALAVVLYELLAGAPPFDPDLSLGALYRHHVEVVPPPPPGVPNPVADVVMRSLAKDSAARHPSAHAFALDLAVAAARAYGPNWASHSGITLRITEDVWEAANRSAADGTAGDRPASSPDHAGPTPRSSARALALARGVARRRNPSAVKVPHTPDTGSSGPATRRHLGLHLASAISHGVAQRRRRSPPPAPGPHRPDSGDKGPEPRRRRRRLGLAVAAPRRLRRNLPHTHDPDSPDTGGAAPNTRRLRRLGLDIAIPLAILLVVAPMIVILLLWPNILLPRPTSELPLIVTVAGTDAEGFSNDVGRANQTQLATPASLAVDNDGNLYIAELHGYWVRRVDTNGTITTLAGTGIPGFSGDGGPATQATLAGSGVAVDGDGNLYITDADNHRVRRVDANGTITTLAGTGDEGYSGDGGHATRAKLRYPTGIAVDGGGNLYIADTHDNRVRRVDANGTITTVAGTGDEGYSGDGGHATRTKLRYPTGIAVDDGGNLYIAETDNHRIRRVDTNGTITTVAGTGDEGYSGDGGHATRATLAGPAEVVVDGDGNLYIADTGNNRVRRVDINGTITTVAGTGIPVFSGDGGPAIRATLAGPTDVVVDGDGNLYIADTGNNRVRRVDAND